MRENLQEIISEERVILLGQSQIKYLDPLGIKKAGHRPLTSLHEVAELALF